MAEKNSLWKNIRKKAEQNRRTGATPKKPTAEMLRQERKIKAQKAKGGPVGDDGLYNMQRALELGYTPDETGHWPSVDSETGMWLKSKEHPTAWMEYMHGYALNPEVQKQYQHPVVNPEGYFGENQLQYNLKPLVQPPVLLDDNIIYPTDNPYMPGVNKDILDSDYDSYMRWREGFINTEGVTPEEFFQTYPSRQEWERKNFDPANLHNGVSLAQGGPTGGEDDPFKSTLNEGVVVSKPAQDFVSSWVRDPEFANRLNKNFPDHASKLSKKFYGYKEAKERAAESNLKSINKAIPGVISDIYNTQFLYNTNPEINSQLLNSYRASYNDPEYDKFFEKNMSKNPQGFTDEQGRIVITNAANDQYGPQSVSVHELMHKTGLYDDETFDRTFRGKFLTPSQDRLDKDFNRGEMYPFLMQMRFDNNFQPGETITPERLKQIKESGYKNHLFKYYTDDEISKYLNTLASNQTQTPVQYAAQGGYVDGDKDKNKKNKTRVYTDPREFRIAQQNYNDSLAVSNQSQILINAYNRARGTNTGLSGTEYEKVKSDNPNPNAAFSRLNKPKPISRYNINITNSPRPNLDYIKIYKEPEEIPVLRKEEIEYLPSKPYKGETTEPTIIPNPSNVEFGQSNMNNFFEGTYEKYKRSSYEDPMYRVWVSGQQQQIVPESEFKKLSDQYLLKDLEAPDPGGNLYDKPKAQGGHINPYMYYSGGPIDLEGTDKIYSTTQQNSSQSSINGRVKNYYNNFLNASTNINSNGNVTNQYSRQTTDPNSTPVINYFNDSDLGSQLKISGPGNNVFIKPDPIMNNFLNNRTQYLSGAMSDLNYAKGGPMQYKRGGALEDVGKLLLNFIASPFEQISGNNFVNFNYNNKGFANAAAVMEGVAGAGTDFAGSVFLGPAYGMGKGAIQGVTKNLGHSQEYQRGADKWANKTGQIASSAGNLTSGIMSGNPQQIIGGAGQVLGTLGSEFGSKELNAAGQLVGMGSQFVNPSQGMPSTTPSVDSSINNFQSPVMYPDQMLNQGLSFTATGGNINNNSLNLQNSMRGKYNSYKRKYSRGGTFQKFGINEIPDSAGLHHQNSYGGVPIGRDAMAEGGEFVLDGNYVVSDQVDGMNTQTDEFGRTMAENLKRDLSKYTMRDLNSKNREGLRRPMDPLAQETINQIKQKAMMETEMARAEAQAKEQERQAMVEGALQYAAAGGKLNKDITKIVEEEYAAAYGGQINPKKYKGLNMPGYSKGGKLPKEVLRARVESHMSPQEADAYVNQYGEGGSIHIKESKKGTFTAAAKKRGKSVQEFARQVLANKGNYSSAMVKKANFARNAASWKHAHGGPVVSNVNQAFGLYAQNRGGMMMAQGGNMYANGGPGDELDPEQLKAQGFTEYEEYFYNPTTGQYVDKVSINTRREKQLQERVDRFMGQDVKFDNSAIKPMTSLLSGTGIENSPINTGMMTYDATPQATNPLGGIKKPGMENMIGPNTFEPGTTYSIANTNPYGSYYDLRYSDPYSFDFSLDRFPILDRQGNIQTTPEDFARLQSVAGTDIEQSRLNRFTEPYNQVMSTRDKVRRAYQNKSPYLDNMVDEPAKPNKSNTYLRNLNTPNYVDNQGNTSSILSRRNKNQSTPVDPIKRMQSRNLQQLPTDNTPLSITNNYPESSYRPATLTEEEQNMLDRMSNTAGFIPSDVMSGKLGTSTAPYTYEEGPINISIPREMNPGENIRFTPPGGSNIIEDLPGTVPTQTKVSNAAIGLNDNVSDLPLNFTEKSAKKYGLNPDVNNINIVSDPKVNQPNQPNQGLGILDYGSMIGQAAGPLSQLYYGLKGPDDVNYERIKADKIDPYRAITLANEESRRAQDTASYNLRQNAPTSGSYMSNMRGLGLQAGKQRGAQTAGIQYEADIANTQMQNQVNAQNATIAMQEQIDRLQEKDAARTNVTEGLSGMGASTANMIRDYRTNQINQMIAKNIGTNNYKYDPINQTITYRTQNGEMVTVPAETVTGTNPANIATGEMQQSQNLPFDPNFKFKRTNKYLKP